MSFKDFREVEKEILDDGWYLKSIKGSHHHYKHHYKHPDKQGKVTIPKHPKGIEKTTYKSILKQAGLS